MMFFTIKYVKLCGRHAIYLSMRSQIEARVIEAHGGILNLFQSKMGSSQSKTMKTKNISKKPKITDRDRAVLDLKIARDNIKKSLKSLEAESDKLTLQAKALIKMGRKERAITILKLKRLKEESILKADADLLHIQKLAMGIDNAISTVELVKRIEAGTKVMTSIMKDIPIEKIERLMEDNDDAIAAQRDMDNVLAQNSELGAMDDEELARELAAITLPEDNADAAAASSSSTTPVTPVTSSTGGGEKVVVPPTPPFELPTVPQYIPTHVPSAASTAETKQKEKVLVPA